MLKFVEQFYKNETGAVSVEWVVITAAIVGLSISAGSIVETQTHQLAADIGATLNSWDVTAAPLTAE